jgi:DNA-binding IclR family transcriptional regulator
MDLSTARACGIPMGTEASMSDTSVERAFAILETFERERRPLSLKDLSEQCSIPASTCHTLVHTLLRRAYLYQTGRRKDLYPTRRLYDLGKTILTHDPVLQRLAPAMEDLRDTTRETVILGKRQGSRILYLEVLESPEVIRYSARPGDTKPLHSTCIGKALLSVLPTGEIGKVLGSDPLPRITDNTITTLETLLDDLAAGQRAGYFVTRGENVADVTALAVPLAINDDLFALAVAGPSHRVDARLQALAAGLVGVRHRLSEQGVTVAP